MRTQLKKTRGQLLLILSIVLGIMICLNLPSSGFSYPTQSLSHGMTRTFVTYSMMHTFNYTDADLDENSKGWTRRDAELSEFDHELRTRWNKALDEGHFRYKLDKLKTRIIGTKGYVAQLNVKRAQERRKPAEITHVNQPFNPAGFNFTKIQPNEILFKIVKSGAKRSHNQANGYWQEGDSSKSKVQDLMIINASPLEYGHVLIVPDVDAMKPQILTQHGLRLAIDVMLLSRHRGFRVGFNSLCAFASVNHQHIHAYYVETELMVEHCPVTHISGILHEINITPAKGFAFQLHGSTIDQTVSVIINIIQYFQQNEIAHNLFLTRGTVFGQPRDSTLRTIRFLLFPRKKFIGIKEEAAFNVAVAELSGHLPIKIEEMFEDLDEEKIEQTIRDQAVLEETEYNKIKQDVLKICQTYCS
ncbi:hypothetical protein CHS0354_034894 [Potamilus streckersoni]|uniref:GDP-D-glucose phosphorylase 1 n=1 Tax=Potamilus streckersoni TaxID=2493646 RepID=A0AAE0S7P3_9BIVA|nr:hypothetical protein CHS0354_034894 [Potamilus streckersoni]